MTTILTGILFVSMCLASTAALSYSLESGKHEFITGDIVKYNKPIYNGGAAGVAAYNPLTGVFTTPATGGTYLISVTLMSGFKSAHLTVRKGPAPPGTKGLILGWLFTDKTFNIASLSIDYALADGDTIWVEITTGTELFDVYNTFSVAKIAA
ncbi:uncharacterized protein LOC134697276 [Mytilus trossulus]|uniref:uncharacterized protein LOC134697276 n=1 Tax=Mytilus trossulus TaxID=6551 RepID=UPI003007E2A2